MLRGWLFVMSIVDGRNGAELLFIKCNFETYKQMCSFRTLLSNIFLKGGFINLKNVVITVVMTFPL